MCHFGIEAVDGSKAPLILKTENEDDCIDPLTELKRKRQRYDLMDSPTANLMALMRVSVLPE